MYSSLRSGSQALPHPTASDDSTAEPIRSGRKIVGRNVLALGMTSLFTDISSEMVVAVLPLYLTFAVGWTTIGYGLFDGVYQLIDAVFRLVGADRADRTRDHKRVATSGYALSAVTRLGLFASTMVTLPVTAILLVERVGKGLRAAPRDALISLSTTRDRLGMAFGVHRMMDTTGAMLGPFVAFAVLWAVPGGFDSIFVLSLAFAVIGVLIIHLLVESRPVAASSFDAVSSRSGIAVGMRTALERPGVVRIALSAFVLGMVSISDAFVYLVIQRETSMEVAWFPLLFAATALVYLVLAIPVGAIADRVGRRAVFVGGHVALLAVYLTMLSGVAGTMSGVRVAACVLLLGVFFACTDGVLAAAASAASSENSRTSAIASVSVAGAIGRLISSSLFGACWYWFGLAAPLWGFAIGLAVAVPLVGRYLSFGRNAA